MSDAWEALADVRGWLCDNLSDKEAGKVCGMLSAVSREINRLGDENEKLRKLVLCLLTCASYDCLCDSCPLNGGPGIWEFEDFCDGLLDLVHELRIEVG